MYHVNSLVEKEKLVEVLVALYGLTHGYPEVYPVNNKVVNKTSKLMIGYGSSLNLLKDHLSNHLTTGDKISQKESHKMMKLIGRSPGSAHNLFQRAIHEGLIKKHGMGKGSYYEVL